MGSVLLIALIAGSSMTAINTCGKPPGINIIAHRGSMQDAYPENTLAAIRRAHEIGVSTVELDVRPARDGQPVLIHDAGLRRTTNGAGTVRTMTVEQLRQLDAGLGHRIPTLNEGLTAARGLGLTVLLDFKETQHLKMADLASDIGNKHPQGSVIFGVRTIDALRQVRQTNPSARVLGFVRTTNQIEPFINAGANIIRLWGHRVISSPQLVQQIQLLGTKVWVTTGKTQGADMQRILTAGVDGVITDVPDQLLSATCCC